MKKGFPFIFVCLMFIFFFTVQVQTSAQVKKAYDEYTIYIDPGHGGYDGGAKRNNDLIEKELNLSVALYLRNYLEQVGINVLLTRNKDMDFVSPGKGSKKKRDLDKRIEMINNSNCDFFVSIHMNALRNPRWHGAQTFYFDNFAENKLLAEKIQQTLVEVLQNTHRKAKTVNTLYLFKKVKKPGALIEVGFLSNPYEANLLKQRQYQDKVAFGIYLGIIHFLNKEDILMEY
ncbi:N-acetylmuramoyl-L-alanine amidase CwlD [Mycoplasmatota bacterium]|nr:N-acetylmuramoyl-L-alanine amidase CwlD [Mycoplasmatota bacterium]